MPTDSGPGSDAQSPPDAGGACVCASGVCCDGCYYKWIDVQCDAVPVETEYRCTGSGCGADLERRQSFRHCDGQSSGCGIGFERVVQSVLALNETSRPSIKAAVELPRSPDFLVP